MAEKRSALVEKSFGWIDVAQCVMANWNYKKDDEYKTARLMANFKRNGQVENIIVRPLDTGFFEVVNGNHRLDAIQRLEWEKIFVYNTGKISLPAAIRLSIETNETKYENDQFALADRIQEITAEYELNDLKETMPYTDIQFDNLLSLADKTFDHQSMDSLDHVIPDEKTKLIGITVPNEIYELWNEIKLMLEQKDVLTPVEAMIYMVKFTHQSLKEELKDAST
jgi:hypothetical protein